MARSVNVSLGIDDFQSVSDRIPFLADLKPSGLYVMEDLHTVGGIPAVMRFLIKEGLMSGDCMTVTGKTISENLEKIPDLSEGQKVIHSLANPIKETGHMRILKGNLAPGGAVMKPAAADPKFHKHTGPALVFDSYPEIKKACEDPDLDVTQDTVLILRNAGPIGGPGMPEWGMLPLPIVVERAGMNSVPLMEAVQRYRQGA